MEQRWRQTSVRQYLISNIRKTSLIWYRIIKHAYLTDNIKYNYKNLNHCFEVSSSDENP